MAKHKIVIDVMDRKSVTAALKQVEKLTKSFDAKVDQFIREIVGIGMMAAQSTYGSAVSVTAEATGDGGWIIRAEGEPVVFFEFGAGKGVNESNELVSRMPFEVYDGSYSDMMHGDYQASGYVKWRYDGVTYYEIIHRDGMQQALIEMLDKWREIAERVFG